MCTQLCTTPSRAVPAGFTQPAPPRHLTPPASTASAASAALVGTPSASRGFFHGGTPNSWMVSKENPMKWMIYHDLSWFIMIYHDLSWKILLRCLFLDDLGVLQWIGNLHLVATRSRPKGGPKELLTSRFLRAVGVEAFEGTLRDQRPF